MRMQSGVAVTTLTALATATPAPRTACAARDGRGHSRKRRQAGQDCAGSRGNQCHIGYRQERRGPNGSVVISSCNNKQPDHLLFKIQIMVLYCNL